MAITMMQLLTGLTGFVGCLVCMSFIRIILGISAVLTAISVTGNMDDNNTCDDNGDKNGTHIETIFLIIVLCIHLAINFVFGQVTPGNLNYSLTADIIDWICTLIEYGMAIHLLAYFNDLSECLQRTEYSYANDPSVVWDLLVAWIAFDSILFCFRALISYMLYRKLKSRGHQTKYVLQ